MSHGVELLDAVKLLLQLRTDAGLQALFPASTVVMYTDFVPREPPAVYIVISLVQDRDTNTIGVNRVMNSPTFHIEVIGREVGYDVLRPISEYIDHKITAYSFAQQVGNTWVGQFMRQNVIMHADNLDNVRWYCLGGIYDTRVFTTQ